MGNDHFIGRKFSVQAQRCQEVRAGIDMGSGTTKLLVAEVDTCRQHINKVLFEDQRPVGFNQNLSQSTDNMLSPAIQSQGKRHCRIV
jgi:exopolyphosphatase/guanosine-5'-triphosphate,3'-diphosphate pyrophosphatase